MTWERSIRHAQPDCVLLAGHFPAAFQPVVFQIKVEAAGFKTFERTSINLTANDRLSIGTIALQIGSATESVTVKAEGAAVQTASAEHSGVLTSAQVDSLLMKGRNIV